MTSTVPLSPAPHPTAQPVRGLRENAGQFWLLVLINAFVGAMVGLERHILPQLGEIEFGIASRTALLSFIATFGAVKAVTNYFAGRLGDLHGRRRILIAGWLFGIPVPLLIMWAPSWGWIIAGNVLLGVNQGLAWSTTVIMKIDLVGSAQRGLAMGLNEFAGYIAVGAAAFGSGMAATAWGMRPTLFYVGLALVAAGLSLSLLFVRETAGFVELEASASKIETRAVSPRALLARGVWSDRVLSSCNHVGLANNLNDGVAWGILPLLLLQAGLPMSKSALIVGAYPAVWGAAQLVTGAASDRFGRKPFIVTGMIVQAGALFWIAIANAFGGWLAGAVVLGVGTAMVYPTLLAAVGDVAHPSWRGTAVGIYRMWRDAGYVVGALGAGLIADLVGLSAAVGAAAATTLFAGLLALVRMPTSRDA